MEYLIVGICVCANIVFIKMKYDQGNLPNAFLDALLLVAVMWLFKGSEGALIIGTIASALISLYLFISPLKARREKHI